jgi:preprotein translocase subunit SecB
MTTEQLKKHPIQLVEIRVNDLTFKRMKYSDGELDVSFQIATGKAEFAPDSDIIKCGIKAECQGKQGSEIEFLLNVEIIGIFAIDKPNFSAETVPLWQEKNAPFILMPFLREQVYGLSIRAGLPPIIIPMAVVPTTRGTSVKTNPTIIK